ncbi:MAG: hypothetical protein C5B47_03600 [Verrucomicrobia bacterium]|nr:MAG: hypothetical protein C5B47_03600 [Verrucomicrobiota bacterium]
MAVVSALLAPPIYWFIQGIHVSSWLQEFPFHRVFSRVLLVCILIAIGPLLIALKISSLRDLGLQKNPGWRVDFLWGLFVGLLTVSVLMVGYISFGIYYLEDYEIEPVELLSKAGSAIAVSLLEEILFRGVLYGFSRRVFGVFASAVWTSALFAVLHFIRSSGGSSENLNMWSGFYQFTRIFSGAPPFPLLLFAFATLFSMGLLLCWTVERTRSLALPIGLHAGWIFAIQTFNLFIEFESMTPIGLPWVGPNVISGMVPVGVFAILSICVTFLLCRGYLYGRPHQNSSTKCA